MSLEKEEISDIIDQIYNLIRRWGPGPTRNLRIIMRQFEAQGTINRQYLTRLRDNIESYKLRDPAGERYVEIDEVIELLDNVSDSIRRVNREKIQNEILEKITTKDGKIKIVFFFGSGASRPAPSNIPVVNEMLEYLVRNLPPTEMPLLIK